MPNVNANQDFTREELSQFFGEDVGEEVTEFDAVEHTASASSNEAPVRTATQQAEDEAEEAILQTLLKMNRGGDSKPVAKPSVQPKRKKEIMYFLFDQPSLSEIPAESPTGIPGGATAETPLETSPAVSSHTSSGSDEKESSAGSWQSAVDSPAAAAGFASIPLKEPAAPVVNAVLEQSEKDPLLEVVVPPERVITLMAGPVIPAPEMKVSVAANRNHFFNAASQFSSQDPLLEETLKEKTVNAMRLFPTMFLDLTDCHDEDQAESTPAIFSMRAHN